MFAHRSSTGPVDLAFTDRYDGVSAVPFDSLNLALVGDDDPPRSSATSACSSTTSPREPRWPTWSRCTAHVVVEAGGARERCDALVTDRPDVVLLVRVADCVPVLLADPVAGVIGAAHAGRQGLVEGVVEGCVTRMRELGAAGIEAWVGPHICGSCYEVPEALQHEVIAPASRPRGRPRRGAPRRSTSAPGSAPSSTAPGSPSTTSPAARSSHPTSTPTDATGRVPGGSPG